MRSATNGELPPYRRPIPSNASGVAFALIAFVFTGWMLTQGYSPVVSVATASSVMVVTTTLSRGRVVGFRPVIWEKDAR
ncbi:hypothetical protein [Lentzea sp. NPDC092896]|uniref:hypothetical protein n=1 Tax=Lentzea sp. NPDC092896 TaxID=3364127 RepID=UPI003809AE61